MFKASYIYLPEESSYGENIPESIIQSGGISLYQDELMLIIKEDKMSFSIKNLEPKVYGWQLGIMGKTIVLDEHIDEEGVNGLHFEYLDILNLSDDKLKVRIYNNRFYTGIEKPYCYLLNEI